MDIQNFKSRKSLYPVKVRDANDHISHSNRFSFKKQARWNQKNFRLFLDQVSSASSADNMRFKAYLSRPYFPVDWSLEKQLNAISTHYQLLDSLPQFLNVSDGQTKQLINLNAYSRGACLACGLPQWPDSEGEVALHLIKHNATVMTTPFTLGVESDELVIYLWSIQKPSVDTSNLIPIYKDFSGLRTQDLMIVMLRLLAKKIGAKKILAIADECRNQQLSTRYERISFSYDAIWLTHSGVRLSNGFFEIPIEVRHPALETIPINKQTMIGKRYSILQNISYAFGHSLPN